MAKVSFVAVVLAFLAAAGLSAAKAETGPSWCAQYGGPSGDGGRNCGFASYRQCIATVGPTGGVCERNLHTPEQPADEIADALTSIPRADGDVGNANSGLDPSYRAKLAALGDADVLAALAAVGQLPFDGGAVTNERRAFDLAQSSPVQSAAGARPQSATLPVTPQMFGAVGDLVADDTKAIQTALDTAKATKRSVFIPAGNYLISQIVIPFDTEVGGAGIGGYGHASGSANPTTLLVQKSGINDDAIVFETINVSGIKRVGPYYIHDFAVTKQRPGTDKFGNGISFRSVGDRNDDANHALINGNAVMARVLVRGFPENGIFSRRGCAPAFFQNVYTLFNGNYGMKFEGINGYYGLFIKAHTADGNLNGAMKFEGKPSNQHISVQDVFAETRRDGPYGLASGFPFAQPRVVELGDFGANSNINIQSIFGNSTTTTAVDAAIYVKSSSAASTPNVHFNGINVKRAGVSSGNGYVLSDVFSSTYVPYTVASGVFSRTRNAFSSIGDSFIVAGGNGAFDGFSTTSAGFQAKGPFPSYSWVSSTAGANEKKWFWRLSGSQLILSLASDDGLSSVPGITFTRAGTAPSMMTVGFGLSLAGSVNLSGLPTYANNAAAAAGGLAVNSVYKTSTGELRVRQ